MAKRHAHRLKPFGMGHNPSSIICVQAAVRQQYASDADGDGTQELDTWSACRMEFNGSTYRTGATVHGDTRDEFWRLVGQCGLASGPVWLVSIDAKEHAAILGLWDRIMDRTASVCGADPWSKINPDDSSERGGSGFVILESPPTVIQFALADIPGKCVWVDPANYGADDLYRTARKASKIVREPGRTPEFCWLDGTTLPYQVEAVSDWLNAYVDTLISLGIGAIENTAASQAMAGFRRRYMRDNIYVHDNLPTLALERAGLYGGRCECSFVGTVYGCGVATPVLTGDETPGAWKSSETPIYHLDANSLYPSVAATAMLPIKLIASVPVMPVEHLLKAVDTMPCVARVYVETECPCVPARRCTKCGNEYRIVKGRCRACNGPDSSTMIFPIGKFWTTLCGPEVLLAFDLGKVTICTAFAGYEAAPIYRDWVLDLYNARIEAEKRGDRQMANCCKRLLNASFGKWAQRSRKWKAMPDELCLKPFSQWWQVNDDTGQAEQWRSFAWAVERCEDAGEPSESIPIITAMIHSLARVRMYTLMELCGRNNMYYMDTDSIWCNEQGYNTLVGLGEVDATALGKLKVVNTHSCVTWWGQKRYEADGRLTVSGAPLGSVRTGDAFGDTLRAAPLQHYLFADQAPGIERHTARVRLTLPYSVGRVGPTGEVEPLKVLDTEDAT